MRVQKPIGTCLGRFSAGLAVAVALLACSSTTTIKGWSEQSYRNPALTLTSFSNGGMALLPAIILQGQGSSGKSSGSTKLSAPYAPSPPASEPGNPTEGKTHNGYRVIFDEVLLSTLKKRWPDFLLIPTGDVLKQLNDAGMAEDYGRFDRDFATVGLDGELLKKFGEALQVRYLFISQVVISDSTSDASVSFIWSFGRKSVLSSVKIVTQIWDTRSQQLAWEGSGVAYNRLGAYEKPPLTEQMANMAVQHLVEALQP